METNLDVKFVKKMFRRIFCGDNPEAEKREEAARENLRKLETELNSSNVKNYVEEVKKFLSMIPEGFIEDDDIEDFFAVLKNALGEKEAVPYQAEILEKGGYYVVERFFRKAIKIMPYESFVKAMSEREEKPLNIVEKFVLTQYSTQLREGFFEKENPKELLKCFAEEYFGINEEYVNNPYMEEEMEEVQPFYEKAVEEIRKREVMSEPDDYIRELANEFMPLLPEDEGKDECDKDVSFFCRRDFLTVIS